MRTTDDWLEKMEKEKADFVSGWDWGRVSYTWQARVDDFATKLHPLFTDVILHDPKYPMGPNPVLSWWPASRIGETQVDLQRDLDGRGHVFSPHPYQFRKGELDTLRHLWEYREDANKTAAIFIAASLFSRIYSDHGRSYYPNGWPPIYCAKVLSDWAYDQWIGQKGNHIWHSRNTEVLPKMNEDFPHKLNGMYALVRYLAEEHAALLASFRPVRVVFSDKRDPVVEKALAEEVKGRAD